MDKQITQFRGKYTFLSNFYNTEFMYKNEKFSNSEQAFHWEKAEDEKSKKLILGTDSPVEAKKIGRQCKCDIERWDKVKFDTMEQILIAKFSNPELQKKLQETKDYTLVEGNYWHDNIWGVCGCARCSVTNKGANNLGRILMKIRDHHIFV
jgi:ribA/ribD-fused uncharacterized protein